MFVNSLTKLILSNDSQYCFRHSRSTCYAGTKLTEEIKWLLERKLPIT